MDITLSNRVETDIESKLNTVLGIFKLSNIEKTLSDMLDNMKNDNPVNYVGELNKYDIMH